VKFIWNGREFPADGKTMFEEIDFVERKTGQPMDEWSKTTTVRASIFWAVRRVDPELLSWEELGRLGPDGFEIIDDAPAGADAGPPAVTPSDSPDGPVAAADSSTTGEPTT
jgi:hypothetical protein